MFIKCYESSYKEVNVSYIIGQLTLGSWHFQKDYKIYSQRMKILYNKINLDVFNIEELEEFKSLLWKKYKENFSTKEVASASLNFE